jgi:transcriptional regulator with XRE-family HTH domain
VSALDDIGDALRQRRKELGLTQQEAASLAGISRGYLSEIERGGRDLSVTILLGIADALQVQCRWVPVGDAHTRPRAAIVSDASDEQRPRQVLQERGPGAR